MSAREARDARALAVEVIGRVERDGAFSQRALDAALRRVGSAEERRLATRLVYGTLQWRGQLDYHLSARLARPLKDADPLVRRILRVGAFQLLHMPEVPGPAVVHATVDVTRTLRRAKASGLVNAVLRRLLRERDALPLPDADAAPLEHLCVAGSLPRWLAERWLARLGAAEALALARALNDAPPATVRVRAGRATREALAAALGGTPTPLARDGLRLERLGPALRHESFAEGLWTVQDEASMLVTERLDPRPGDRVLDACAAPGGKTGHIAERLGGDGVVDAVDRHEGRCGLVRAVVERLGLTGVRVHAGDVRTLDLPESAYDRALVDAPCSALGTLRRHPERKWRARPDLAALAAAQGALLASVAGRVRPGGVMVYSVCSTEPEEGEEVLAEFLAGPGAGWAVETPADERRTWPHRDDTDGFFAVRLRAPG